MNACSTDECMRPVLGRGLCAPCYSRWHRAQMKYTVTCATCGIEAKVDRKRNRYCTRKCANLANARLVHPTARPRCTALERYTGPRRTPRPKPTAPSRRRRFTAGRCKVCAASFVSRRPSVTCSAPCQAAWKRTLIRLKSSRHDTRKRNAYVQDVDPQRVFETDGWRCHICKGKLSRNTKVPHPRAPTVDHVIPLSKGGSHEPVNCRAAHFICNSRKADLRAGDQMLLLAI